MLRDKSDLYDGLYDPQVGLSPGNAAKVGTMTARLILSWGRWIHRRVERVTFCDEAALRRDVSVDFTLPRGFHKIRGTGEEVKRQLVPLGFLHKGALINFSLRDESDASLPLLTTPQNTQIAKAVLISLAETSLKKAAMPTAVPEEIVTDIEKFVQEKPKYGDILDEDLFARGDGLQKVRNVLMDEETFLSTAELFWTNFLALSMVMIRQAERRILHFSYEEPRTPTGGIVPLVRHAIGKPRVAMIAAPSASEAASYHLEAEAPEGMMIPEAISYFHSESGRIKSDPIRGNLQRAHYHFANLRPRSVVDLVVYLMPRRSSGVRGATLMSLLALLTSLVVTVRYGHITQGGSAIATTLLLAATGIIGLVVVRSGEELMATTLLFALRILATTPVVLAVCAALVVISDPPKGLAYGLLGLITTLIAVSTGLLIWNWHVIRRVLKARTGNSKDQGQTVDSSSVPELG